MVEPKGSRWRFSNAHMSCRLQFQEIAYPKWCSILCPERSRSKLSPNTCNGERKVGKRCTERTRRVVLCRMWCCHPWAPIWLAYSYGIQKSNYRPVSSACRHWTYMACRYVLCKMMWYCHPRLPIWLVYSYGTRKLNGSSVSSVGIITWMLICGLSKSQFTLGMPGLACLVHLAWLHGWLDCRQKKLPLKEGLTVVLRLGARTHTCMACRLLVKTLYKPQNPRTTL